MGPVVIFDKSTLQSLSFDEAIWLENFFYSNITPMLFIETLADLSKPKTPRGAEALVRDIARKTPVNGSFPNAFHHPLIGNSLVGNHPPMRNQVVLVGGETRRSPEGKIGAHFDEFDESAALWRWQEGEFHEIEHRLAGAWRSLLTNIDFRSMMKEATSTVGVERVRALEEAHDFCSKFVQGPGLERVRFARRYLGIGPQWQNEIDSRYADADDASLSEFAPYAAFVLKVTLFFYIAMASHLIARERPSNMIDISYLFYLPFCNVFVSSDRLHARTAPFFCEQGQEFVEGKALKAALRELNAYYSEHEAEIERVGIVRFAPRPPIEMDNAVTRMWDKFLPRWRETVDVDGSETSSETASDMTIEKMRSIMDESVTIPERPGASSDYAIIKRRLPVRRGRWRLLPPEAEKSRDDH